MAIQLSTPPSGAIDIVKSSLQQLSPQGGAAARALRGVNVGALKAGLPHPVYTVGADVLANNGDIEAEAKLTAWRYLIVSGSQALAAIELSYDSNGNLGFSSLNTGPFVEATRVAFQMAEQLPEVVNGSYELRVLQIASLYVMALWLKNQQPGPDLVLPMNPTNQVLAAHPAAQARLAAAPPAASHAAAGIFTLPELATALQPESASRLAFDDTPKYP